MSDYDYELVVIGGGPAGEKGAAQAAYFGHKTIVIEAYRELGGACINWGTLASKTLRESALFLSGFRTRQLGEGLNVQFKADITLNSFMHRKNLVQRREQERAARNLAASWHNIAQMTGVARIVDPKPRALDSLLDGEIGEEFMSRMRRDGIELCMNESLPDATEDPAAIVSENGQVNV